MFVRTSQLGSVSWTALAGFAVTVAVGVLIIATQWRDTGVPPTPQGGGPSPVPAPAERQFLGRPSRDGRSYTFVDMNGDLGVFATASGEQRILTNRRRYGGFAYESSAFSADGSRIAFAWEDADGAYELRVTTADGTDTRVVLADPEEVPHPLDWSPDGEHVLVRFERTDGTRSLGLVSIPNGRVRRIAAVDAAHTTATVSPDGRHIVFDCGQGADRFKRDVFITAVTEAAEPMALVAVQGDDFGPLWTPDGTRVVFISDRTGEPSVWAVAVRDGVPVGEPAILHRNIGRVTPSGLSTGGTLYYTLQAVTSGASSRELWALDLLLQPLQ